MRGVLDEAMFAGDFLAQLRKQAVQRAHQRLELGVLWIDAGRRHVFGAARGDPFAQLLQRAHAARDGDPDRQQKAGKGDQQVKRQVARERQQQKGVVHPRPGHDDRPAPGRAFKYPERPAVHQRRGHHAGVAGQQCGAGRGGGIQARSILLVHLDQHQRGNVDGAEEQVELFRRGGGGGARFSRIVEPRQRCGQSPSHDLDLPVAVGRIGRGDVHHRQQQHPGDEKRHQQRHDHAPDQRGAENIQHWTSM